MNRNVLLAISPYIKKYYFNEKYKELPKDIKNELIEVLAAIAEKINGIITIGFEEDGDIYFEERYEDPMLYDDIGGQLEIRKLQREKQSLFEALKLWYQIYHTEQGEEIKKTLIDNNNNSKA